MAQSKVCDLCGEPAITTARFETDVTTPLKWDLCEKHLAELKAAMRVFSKQDPGVLKVSEESVEIVNPSIEALEESLG
jgi:hypothetical protein